MKELALAAPEELTASLRLQTSGSSELLSPEKSLSLLENMETEQMKERLDDAHKRDIIKMIGLENPNKDVAIQDDDQ